MAEETITILKVGTEEAVKNVNDLRNNIKILKENLGELEIGTEEYKDTLDELKVNQNALKDAMYATSASMEDVSKSAAGASESYNSLVHRMASLKEEFRATNDAARRADLGNQIKSINDQLKTMDALQGNFQRNVGNYANSIKEAFGGLSKQVDVFGKSLGVAGSGVNGLKNGMDAISKSPFIATFGILVSLALKLGDELKDNETAMAGIKKAMDALKPVMDFFSGLLETIAGFLGDIITKVAEFISSNGIFQKVIGGVMGVGNAILQYILTPFKAIISAIKVFKEQGIKGIGDAARAFGQEVKSGFAFKENFKTGQAVAETFIAGAKSKKKDVNKAGKELGKSAADGFTEELKKISDEIDKEIEAGIEAFDKQQEKAEKIAKAREDARLQGLEKAVAHQLELNSILEEDEKKRAEKAYEIEAEGNRKRLALLDQFMEDALSRNDLEAYLAYDQERADLQVEIETNALKEIQRQRKIDLEEAKETAKAKKELLKEVAGATSNILDSIAAMYEADEKTSEKNANKIKALKIASATIDTISGAIAAFMQAQGKPFGLIIGAAQAAAVTAAGIAEIAKIKNTQISGSSSSSPSTLSSPAIAAAPTINTEVSPVRSVTSASEEDRLNQMARDQRVYILSSDIEASQKQIKTQVAESSF